MANAAEIVIRARDEFSAMTAKARQEFAGLVDQYGKPLSNPFEKVEEGAHHASSGMHEAKESAELLKHELGIEMPRALTTLIAQSQTLGPLLAASLSTVAAVSLIQVLVQIPEIFHSMIGAVTGWNEHAQKAYENQISLNKKYVELLKDAELVQIRLAIRAGKLTETGGVGKEIEINQAELAKRQAEVTSIETELANRKSLFAVPPLEALAAAGEAGPSGGTGFKASSESTAELTRRLAEAKKAVADLGVAIKELQGSKLPVAQADDAQKAADRLADLAQKREAAERAFFDWTVNMRIHAKMLKDAELKELDEVGNKLILAQQGAAEAKKQLDEALFRGGMQWCANVNAEQEKQNKLAAEGATFAGKAYAKPWEELKKKHEEFVKSFRESAGHVWDDFFIRGSGILESLANVAKGILNTIGRTLFQDFAAGLVGGTSETGGLTGGVTQFGGLLGGRIGLSRLLTGFGAKGQGVGALSTFAGGGGLLGGLLGAAGATTGFAGTAVGTSALGLAGIPAGALGAGAVAAPGFSLAGSLGLSGGAGLLGLGAATIPIIGGIIAGGLLAFHFLRHHTQEAPFTRDPHEVERNRSVLFFTSLQESMDKFTGGVDAFVQKVQSVKPGDVVMAGMPSAFQSSNSFRRTVAGTLLDDA